MLHPDTSHTTQRSRGLPLVFSGPISFKRCGLNQSGTHWKIRFSEFSLLDQVHDHLPIDVAHFEFWAFVAICSDDPVKIIYLLMLDHGQSNEDVGGLPAVLSRAQSSCEL